MDKLTNKKISQFKSEGTIKAMNDMEKKIRGLKNEKCSQSEEDELLKLPRLGAINVHPYLYKYKGKDPVGRALKDKNFKASVGIHSMGNKVDDGKVITELFTDISGSENVDEAYNKLYPYYCKSILEALNEAMNMLLKYDEALVKTAVHKSPHSTIHSKLQQPIYLLKGAIKKATA